MFKVYQGSYRSFFMSRLSVMIIALTATLLLSYGAASIAGKSFVGADLFDFILKKIMLLDGVAEPNPYEFLSKLGLYGFSLCTVLALALVAFFYCWGLLFIYSIKLGLRFIRLHWAVPKQELPTQDIPEDRLF